MLTTRQQFPNYFYIQKKNSSTPYKYFTCFFINLNITNDTFLVYTLMFVAYPRMGAAAISLVFYFITVLSRRVPTGSSLTPSMSPSNNEELSLCLGLVEDLPSNFALAEMRNCIL